jgi:hypothetical protein
MRMGLSSPPPDRLNAVGVLVRREIEARMLAPIIDALSAEFERERILQIIGQTIIQIARQQGQALAQEIGGNSLSNFAAGLDAWKRDDALEIEVIESHESAFSFNVKRCRYAELYLALGIPELGALLSCGRDFALIEGFNNEIQLSRSQTIMEGAPLCDFRYIRLPGTISKIA